MQRRKHSPSEALVDQALGRSPEFRRSPRN
jgi:hypothetical protein